MGAGEAASAGRTSEAAGELARLVSYVAFLLAAGGLYVAAQSLPTSRWEPLGAGAFPKLVMALLGGLCLVAIAMSVRRLAQLGLPHGASALVRAWAVKQRLVIFVFAAFGIYLLVLGALGFSVATFLFLLVAQLLVAPRTWRARATALVIALVFSFGLNLLFAEVFTVFLPRGALFG